MKIILRQTAIFCDRWHWVMLALASPLLLFPSPGRSMALFIVPGLWLFAWLVGREPLQHTPLNAVLLLMFCMVLISLWATYDIATSLPKISGMVLGIGVFFAVVREVEHPVGRRLSLLAFLGIGLGIAVLGIFGTNWFSSKISLLDPITAYLPRSITRVQGAESGFHPNEVAGALIWVLPLMIATSVVLLYSLQLSRNTNMWEQPKNWHEKLHSWHLIGLTIFCLAAAFFVAMVFLLSQSRGAYVGLAITLAILLLIFLPVKWRWRSLVVIALLAILLGHWITSHSETRSFSFTEDADLTSNSALSLDALVFRIEIWSQAIHGIQDFPLTGMGMNTFRKAVPDLYPLFNITSKVDIGHAHNEFLQAALDLGIPGLIAFLALYICGFWMLIDVWKTTRHSPINIAGEVLVIRSLTLGFGGGLFAHLLYGLTDAVALGAKPGVLFWMLLGLIAGLYEQVCSKVDLSV